jgi:hypothetical protein
MPGTIKDSGSATDVIAELRKLNKTSVIVGVIGQEGSKIQIIAGVHEFGATINRVNKKTGKASVIEIPERSFIRATLDKQSVQDGITKIVKSGVAGILNRMLSADQVADQVGLYVVSQIKNRIVQEDPEFAPLSESYRKRKKGEGILRESNQLLNSISYEVVA